MRFIIKFKSAKILCKIDATRNCASSKCSLTNNIDCTPDCSRCALTLIYISRKTINLWG